MQVISLANQKGGVGKTTLSCLLAFYLAEKRHARVLAVDLDSQRNLSHTLRKFSSGVVSTALFEAPPVTVTTRDSLALIGGAAQLANLERATAAEAKGRVRQFAAHLPPTLGIRMVAALASAEFIAMPIELEEYSTQAVKDMLQTVFGVREQWNSKLKFLGMIANRFMHNSVRQKAALRDLLQNYPQYLLPYKISTRAAIPRALEEGCGVWQLATPAARDAAQEVLQAFDALLNAMIGEPARQGEVA